jgi:hypothetical protein
VLELKPKGRAGSIPTVAKANFSASPVWVHTQSNITDIIFTSYLILRIFYHCTFLCKGLAEQKHALKISEHTLIIMWNHAQERLQLRYPKIPKSTYTAQHTPGKLGAQGRKV